MRTLRLSLAVAAAALWLASTPGAVAQPPAASDHPRDPAARHDLNGDGVITAEEFALSDPRFRYLDVNGDRQISAEELAAAREKHGERMPRSGAGVVLPADADGNREVSAAEWQQWLDTVDPDADGTIVAGELLAAIVEHHPGARFERRLSRGERTPGEPDREQMATRLTGHLDRDDSGTLTRDDLQQIFAGLDENGDGALTDDELPRPFGPHGDHHFGRHHGRDFGGHGFSRRGCCDSTP